jgi:GNAT superfamily N-acetyltransferase
MMGGATGLEAEVAVIDRPPVLRPATPDDVPALEALIVASATAITGDYAPAEAAAALAHVFGVDTQLVADGTYYVAERDGVPAGCGGWSRRRTLFGSDRCAGRAADLLDPAAEPARIRAFFVHPAHARAGIARALLARCEAAAAAAGFTELALAATLPGLPFYRRHGFGAERPFTHDAGGTPVRFVAMTKTMADGPNRTAPENGLGRGLTG